MYQPTQHSYGIYPQSCCPKAKKLRASEQEKAFSYSFDLALGQHCNKLKNIVSDKEWGLV
jgi:hypothetical protein